MKKHECKMKHLHNFILSIILLFSSFTHAQNAVLEGQVLDAKTKEPLQLQQQLNELESVVVSGQKATNRVALDKQIIDPKKFQLAANGTGLDLLQKLPAIRVSGEGEISLRGSTGFIVLLNGKPSNRTPADILAQLPANTIQNIEIISTPSAKYDADGKAGIINIITLQEVNKGWSFAVNRMFGGSSPYRSGADINLHYSSKKWDFYAAPDYRRYTIEGKRVGEIRSVYKDTLTYLPSVGIRNYSDLQYSFRTGTSYTPNASNNFSLNLYHGYKESVRQADLHYQEYYKVGETHLFENNWGTVRELSFNENLFVRTGKFSSVNLDYTHRFQNKAQLILTGIYEHSVLGGPLDNLERIENSEDYFLIEHSNESSPLDAFRFQADFSWPIGEFGKLGTGMSWRHFNQKGIFGYSRKTSLDAPAYEDPLYNDVVKVKQHINAGYVQWENKYEQWSYAVGLRLEDMDRKLDDRKEAKSYPYQQLNVFPSAQIFWKQSESQSFRLGYNRRIDWPTIKSLSPFLNHRHKETIEYGDPNLRPEIADVLELSYSKSWPVLKLVTTAFYSTMQDKVFRTNEIINRTILGRSYINAGNAISTGLEVSADIRATAWWRFYVGTSVYHFHLENILDGQNTIKNNINYTINANTSVNFNPRLRLQWDLNYVSDAITSQGRDGALLLSNVGLKQNIWKNRGTIGLQINNIFQSNNQNVTTQSANFYSTTDYIKYDRALQLSFGFRINESNTNLKKTKAEYGEKEF